MTEYVFHKNVTGYVFFTDLKEELEIKAKSKNIVIDRENNLVYGDERYKNLDDYLQTDKFFESYSGIYVAIGVFYLVSTLWVISFSRLLWTDNSYTKLDYEKSEKLMKNRERGAELCKTCNILKINNIKHCT